MTTGETGDSRNVDGTPGAVWVSAPACVFREEEAQQTHGEAFRRAIQASRKWSLQYHHGPRNHHTRRKCLDQGESGTTLRTWSFLARTW